MWFKSLFDLLKNFKLTFKLKREAQYTYYLFSVSYFLYSCQEKQNKNYGGNYSGKGENLKKSAMLDDVNGPQQHHLHMYPIILTSPCRRHNRPSIEVKTFQNIVTKRKR